MEFLKDRKVRIGEPLYISMLIQLPFRACLLVVSAALLSSCSTLGPQKEVASEIVNLPETFSAIGETEVSSRWWEVFEDETLNRLIEETLEGNLELKEALARVEEAVAVARVSSSDRFPELNAEAGARREDNEGVESDEFSAGLTASYELDLWGRVDALADAERFQAEATREDMRAVAISLSAETALARMDALAARGGVELLQQQVDDNQSLVDLLTNRFRSGQAERVDVLRQQQLLLQTRQVLNDVKTTSRLVNHRLAILTGKAPSSFEGSMDQELPEVPGLPSTGIPLETLTRRPDIRAAWLRIEAADREVAAAISDRFPRISISASYGSEAPELSDLFEDWLWTLAGNIVAPLIDGGERRANVDRADAIRDQRLAAYGQAVLEAMKEVEDALVQEQQQVARLNDLSQQRDLASETLKQLELSYQNGAANFLDVLSARTQLQVLERETLFARRDHLRFRIALYRALAGGIDVEGEDYE